MHEKLPAVSAVCAYCCPRLHARMALHATPCSPRLLCRACLVPYFREAVVLLRKASIVLLVTLVTDAAAQLVGMVLLMLAALLAHLRALPYAWPLFNWLEGIGIVATLTTAAASLLLTTAAAGTAVEAGEGVLRKTTLTQAGRERITTAALISVNMAALAAMAITSAYFYGRECVRGVSRSKVRAAASQRVGNVMAGLRHKSVAAQLASASKRGSGSPGPALSPAASLNPLQTLYGSEAAAAAAATAAVPRTLRASSGRGMRTRMSTVFGVAVGASSSGRGSDVGLAAAAAAVRATRDSTAVAPSPVLASRAGRASMLSFGSGSSGSSRALAPTPADSADADADGGGAAYYDVTGDASVGDESAAPPGTADAGDGIELAALPPASGPVHGARQDFSPTASDSW